MDPSEVKDLAYYKKHIDPSEPKDHELQAMWSRLMVAQDHATTEEEKLSVKRQKEELKAAAAERLRELKPKAVCTPILRGLTVTEANKMQKKIKKRSAQASKWVSKNAEKCFKAFEEHMKEKKEKENV
ncbi:uncharacterized protein LOC113285853 [Papaver somniferum]|uniref:uncharacterized protein LOC113285853 n=1 Tax=Papaver somniferum TaxID=3469 RepID=UPI000E6FA746|nr:uncharacterized protein LOC113285853 [Papaver somniferum]